MAVEGLQRAADLGEEELALLIGFERGLARQPLVEALLEKRRGREPHPVRGASTRLLRLYAPWALDLTAAAAALLTAAGDERAQRRFAAWALPPEPGSRAKLGAAEGVSPERVRQVVRSAGARIRRAFDEAPGPLSWAVRTLRSQLGGVTTTDLMADLLTELGAQVTPAAELLPWLAGPYAAVPGRPPWLALEPRRALRLTAECLAADGGVRPMADVENELTGLMINTDQLAPWLAASGAIVVHDLAVVVSGPLVDVVERLLDAHSSPRTVEQISRDLAAGGRAADEMGLAAALRSHRFARTKLGAVCLPGWDEEHRRAAKRAPRRRPAIPARNVKLAGVRSPGPERLWLRVRVDQDVLEGGQAEIPASLAQGLGLAQGGRRTFTSRWGPVSLAHQGSQPTRNSVRAVAMAAGARLNDTLLLGFSPLGDLALEVLPTTGGRHQGDEWESGSPPSLEIFEGDAP
ncbi:MAG: hypothetical protein ACYDD0_02475 [Candidatus Dormibacteria bacterium]